MPPLFAGGGIRSHHETNRLGAEIGRHEETATIHVGVNEPNIQGTVTPGQLGQANTTTYQLGPQLEFDAAAEICFNLFAHGVKEAARRGLILVDTKYEIGRLDVFGGTSVVSETVKAQFAGMIR